MFKWAIINDEISQNLERAIDVCRELNIPGIELRLVEGENIVNFEKEKIRQIAKLIKEAGLEVCCVASPVFKKCKSDDDGKYRSDVELLKKAIGIAQELDSHLIRVFAFLREGQNSDLNKAIERFEELACIVQSREIVIAIENELTSFARTGRELNQFLRAIDSEAVRALWDPVNALLAGETPFPTGYEKVRDLVVHLHVKDLAVAGRTLEQIEFAPVGEGKVNWVDQIKALLEDGYKGYASFETSYRLGKGEKAGERATKKCYANCLQILDELKK